MSIKVSAYVWKHAKHRGTVKMLLLAMADFANDSGICWPSAATLAERINESERHTRRLIKDLVESGDLLVVPGGGRGNTTRYAIAVDMSPKQKEKLNSVLQNSVLDNTVLENTDKTETVTSGDINSDMSGQETVTSGVAVERPIKASGRAKPTKKGGGIRHVDPSLDPKDLARSQKANSARPAYLDRKKAIEQAYIKALGYTPAAFAKEASAAKWLAQQDYTPEQVVGCLRRLQDDEFYARQHISLQTVSKQIGAWVTKNKPKANTNGVHPPTKPNLPDNPIDRATLAAMAEKARRKP